jgi:plastocyanin
MRKSAAFIVLALALVSPACSKENNGPQRYIVDVDAKSTPAEKFQFSAFFPSDLKVNGGDTVRFRNRATEAPHTITFGVEADRSNQPTIVTDTGENPVVLKPCDIDTAPTPKLLTCPDGEELSAFDGTGYWNSGFIQPATAPKSDGPKVVSLKLADDIPNGNYTYVCILHPFMSGTIEVVDEPGDRSLVSDVRDGATESAADAREEAEAFKEPTLERDGDDATVTAGWGNRVTSVNRFGPKEIDVDPGTTVKWKIDNPYEPHNVTFEPAKDSSPFAPGGVKAGGDYAGGLANSGLFGAEGTPFAGEFSLRFTKSGTYDYTCLLHPGMDGTVKVSGG